jgi:hypothetical protein
VVRLVLWKAFSASTLAAFAHLDPSFPQLTGTTNSATNMNLALLSQYAASSFAVTGDSDGAPMITDSSPGQQILLAQPHA